MKEIKSIRVAVVVTISVVVVVGVLLNNMFNLSTPGFIHPGAFDGSDAQKAQVIARIKSKTESTYCGLFTSSATCNPESIQRAEERELKAFKKLTQASDIGAMTEAIDRYCGTGTSCHYVLILSDYESLIEFKPKDLMW